MRKNQLNTSSSTAWTVSTHRTERGRPLPGCLSTEPVRSIFLNSFSTADRDHCFVGHSVVIFSGTVTLFNQSINQSIFVY